MLNGAFALLERSLRIDSRAWSTNLSRLGLMGAIYFLLCYALTTSFMFGAPGLHFFQGIAYLDATFMTLLGIGYFSTSITEEKEEDTLGLMLMAGISPLGILAGKSGGRLWQSLLLVAVQYPFVLLAVTMGGVMRTQVWSVTVALLAYMIFLAGFGLLCSTLAPRSQTAVTWMFGGLVIYFLVPSLAAEWCTTLAASMNKQGQVLDTSSYLWKTLSFVGDICVFLELGDILTTGFSQTATSVQVITNVLAGIVCAGLSWLCFGVATRNPSAEATTRGLVSRNPLSPFSTGTQLSNPSSFRLHAGKWKNPFIWKDFHFVAGGPAIMFVRIAYYLGLGLLGLTLENKSDPVSSGWSSTCIFVMWVSVPIDAARVLSRSMRDEVQGQTLAALIMLPRSPIGIVYSKFAGAMLGWLPAPFIALIITFYSRETSKFIVTMFNSVNGSGIMLVMMVLYFALIPHFAAVLSLYVRWGAVALAIGLTIGVYIGFMMVVMFCVIYLGFSTNYSQYTIFGVLSIIFACMSAVCHLAVLLRFQALGAK